MGGGQEQGLRISRVLATGTPFSGSAPVHDTVILEGSVCEWHRGCACGIPILWREAWLKRVEPALRVDVLRRDSAAGSHASIWGLVRSAETGAQEAAGVTDSRPKKRGGSAIASALKMAA